MSDVGDAQFTTEELLSSAQGNATAFVLATIAYLKEQDLAVDDYVRFFGSKFAPGWEELADQPLAVARTVARNAVSVGAPCARSQVVRSTQRRSSRDGPTRRSWAR